MSHTIPADEKAMAPFGSLLLSFVGVLLLLGIALFVSLYRPEWINFLWLSVATVSSAAFAGWAIGHLLDTLFQDMG